LEEKAGIGKAGIEQSEALQVNSCNRLWMEYRRFMSDGWTRARRHAVSITCSNCEGSPMPLTAASSSYPNASPLSFAQNALISRSARSSPQRAASSSRERRKR